MVAVKIDKKKCTNCKKCIEVCPVRVFGMENEEVELKATLSDEIDADLVKVISDLAARQANMEATMQMIGKALKLTLFDFL